MIKIHPEYRNMLFWYGACISENGVPAVSASHSQEHSLYEDEFLSLLLNHPSIFVKSLEAMTYSSFSFF